MSQDESSPRIDSYLVTLRHLKETSARREVVEREILLAVLRANHERLSESPTQDADQQHLAATISIRSEPQPAHGYYREWMTQFLALLNQYEVALRTGAKDQHAPLLGQMLNLETLLSRCLQGYIILSGVIRDEFNDVVLARFGEEALNDINELTQAGLSDDHYWKALFDRFAFGFMKKALAVMLEEEKFTLGREGSFVAVRFPMDGVQAQMPGTDKQIDKTRLQAAFDATREDPLALKAGTAVALVLTGLAKPMLPPKAPRHDFELLSRVAAMDPAAGHFVEVFVDGQELSPEPGEANQDDPEHLAERIEAGREFLKNQLLAMAAGAALAMGIVREDLGKALQTFTTKEQEQLLAMAGAFEPAALAVAHTLMLEYSLCRLLSEKVADEGAKVQVKYVKQRRAAHRGVESLAAKGFNRIRQKLFFEEDSSSSEWFLFKARSLQELTEALNFSNIEEELSRGVMSLWNKLKFKGEALALINLVLVAKSTQNVQAKVGEILSKLGVVKSEQA